MLTRFGKHLRSLRIERDQKLKDMADELDVTVAYLSAVENGNRSVPDSWVNKIVKGYQLDDTEATVLQNAAYEKKSDIKINIQNAGEQEVGLALSFARKFKRLSIEEMNELQKKLDEM